MCLLHCSNFILQVFCAVGFSVDAGQTGYGLSPCVSYFKCCMEPSGSPALGFQDSMCTMVEVGVGIASGLSASDRPGSRGT